MKEVVWIGDSRKVVQHFPLEARRAVGTQLMLVQNGFDPCDSKPMTSIGGGVREIRVRAGGAYRVIYTVRYDDVVYVLHAFEKKQQKTPRQDLELARQRLAELRRLRR